MMIISERLADRMYKYRWQSAIIGITTLLLLSWIPNIYHPKDGTFIKAVVATAIFSGCVLVALSVIAFQLEPKRGQMRHRSDNPRWLNAFNRIMRMIVGVTMEPVN